MRILIAATLALAASAVAVRAAHAGCRGGSGGSSSSGGHGSSDSSSGSSCSEVSDVVGHQRCDSFGASWAGRARMPALSAEIGFFTRQLETGFGATGVMEHDTGSFTYQVASGDDRATAAGAALRLAMALPAHLHVAAELEIGGLLSDGAADVEMTGPDGAGAIPTMTGHEELYLGAAGAAGVRAQLGRAALSAELAAGVRDVSLAVESRYGSCILSETHHRTSAFIEPRVRLDFWLTPWITIGGFAGSEIDGASRMIGASLGYHVRAFDRGL